jgi:tetratricopeptide (TPR) repeat protein
MESHEYRFDLEAGDYAALTIEQRGIDVAAQVFDPGGKLLAEFNDESRKQGRESVEVVAGSAGAYSVRIKPVYSRLPAGRYEIQLVEIRLAAEDDRLGFESRQAGTQAQIEQDRSAYDESVRLFARALDLADRRSRPNQACIANFAYHLALLKRLKGEYAEAQRLFDRAITIDEKALGREHPETALALRGLGNLYIATADHAKAQLALEESLAILERTLGREHPNVALCLRLLGNLHAYLEDLDRARAYLERGLAIAEKTFDPDDVSLIAVVHDLGDVYRVSGEIRPGQTAA